MEILGAMIFLILAFVGSVAGLQYLGRNNKWVSIYECTCGYKIENGVGKWDTEFFLEDVCPICGEGKSQFDKKGIAQIKVKWFKEHYEYKKDNI